MDHRTCIGTRHPTLVPSRVSDGVIEFLDEHKTAASTCMMIAGSSPLSHCFFACFSYLTLEIKRCWHRQPPLQFDIWGRLPPFKGFDASAGLDSEGLLQTWLLVDRLFWVEACYFSSMFKFQTIFEIQRQIPHRSPKQGYVSHGYETELRFFRIRYLKLPYHAQPPAGQLCGASAETLCRAMHV